ncbi:serine hydrolase domain-containing protein [candidate division KSB1 bacterium]
MKKGSFFKKFLPLVLISILFVHVTAQDKYSETTFKNDIQVKLDSIRTAAGFPGATFAIVLNDGKKFEFATGLSDLEKEIKMKPQDIMFTGSTGKTFASAVALQLVDEGKLDLDTKISKYFENEEWFKRVPNHDEMTVRMIMSHTGGLERYEFKEKFIDDLIANPDKVWKPAELISYILDDQPLHEPGKGWAYSDTDYIFLGMIIEQICENTFYKEAGKRILKPLKLKNTSPSDKRKLEGLITGYTGDKTPPFKLPGKVPVDGVYPINPQFEWTGGGYITNSGDLASWAKVLYEGKVFSRETLTEMLKPYDFRTGQPSETGYGLGVFVFNSPFGKMYGHGGIFPGYQTEMIYLPDLKCSIAMQVNADIFSGKINGRLISFIMRALPVIDNYIDHQN